MIFTRNRTIQIAGYMLCAYLVFSGCWIGAREKPNILVLLVDDLGYHDLGCTGSQIYQTPNLDRLARTSVTFSNAYANYPRCVPSRFAFLTGMYPVIDGDVPDDGFTIENVPPDQNCIQILHQEGYETAFFGKWHLGDHHSSPVSFGFDISVAAGKAGSPRSYLHPFNVPKRGNRKVKKAPIPDVDDMGQEGSYLTDVMTDTLMHYLGSVQDGKPFLAVLSFYAVHQPLEAKQDMIEMNRQEIRDFDYGDLPHHKPEGTGRTKMRQDNPVYAAMVENLDWNIGRILKHLDDLGLERNTIVLFSSDHGGLSNDGYRERNLATSNYPLRAGKGWLYEGGIRVPLFVRFPATLEARRDTTSILMLMDVFPTLVDLVSGRQVTGIDGKSFLPVLNGAAAWSDRTVYWHAPNARPANTGESKASAMRTGNWKLLHFYEKDRLELYDLKNDPAEQTNLASAKPDLAGRLVERLHKWKEGR